MSENKLCYFCRTIIPKSEDNGSWLCLKCQREEQEWLQRYYDEEESAYAQNLAGD